MSVIEIKGMRFYSFHGCFEEERTIGTNFEVDVSLNVDTTKAQKTDALTDTVNYAEVYMRVKEQMEKSSHLLEHVADRIATALLDEFDAICSVAVKVSKMNPPLGGQMERVSVTIDKSR